jgi:hypothetical protein
MVGRSFFTWGDIRNYPSLKKWGTPKNPSLV